jgi:hypothetical protein
MMYPPNYHKCLKLQEALYNDVLNPETTPAARAQLARAWECLEERKRIIRKIPKPKDVDVSHLQKKKTIPHTAELLEMPQPGSSHAKG